MPATVVSGAPERTSFNRIGFGSSGRRGGTNAAFAQPTMVPKSTATVLEMTLKVRAKGRSPLLGALARGIDRALDRPSAIGSVPGRRAGAASGEGHLP